MPPARFLASPSRVVGRVPGGNGARKLTFRADRRGPAFESHRAHKSPDFGLPRKSAMSGGNVGESGNRSFGIPSGVRGGAFSGEIRGASLHEIPSGINRDIVKNYWRAIGFRRRVFRRLRRVLSRVFSAKMGSEN